MLRGGEEPYTGFNRHFLKLTSTVPMCHSNATLELGLFTYLNVVPEQAEAEKHLTYR